MTNIPNTDDGAAILKILDPGGNLSNEGCRQLLEVIMARSEVEKQYHSKISQKRITDINIDNGIELFSIVR